MSDLKNSVLILTTDRQIDRRTLQQADSLEKHGWQVTILAMPHDAHLQIDDRRVVRIRIESQSLGFKNFSLLSFYRKIRRYIPMNSRLIKMLRRIVWTYFSNPEKFYCDLFKSELNRYKPTVVMAVDLPMLPVAAMYAREHHAKLVYDSHELYSEQEFSTREKQQWFEIEKKNIHQCNAVITVNPSISTELKNRYNIDPVHVIYNAIDAHVVSSKNKLFHKIFNLSLERKILLFQGGLSKGRHLETLIHAIKYIKNELIDLVILGDGQLRKILERKTRLLGLKDRVYFHSAVPQEKLLEYTQAADAGIIPYQATCLNNYYCTPNKLFEFIAAGVPILGNHLPEINQIVKKYEIGLTGTMRSATELATLIDDFFANELQFLRWKKNSIIAQQHFSWHNEENKLSQILMDVIK